MKKDNSIRTTLLVILILSGTVFCFEAYKFFNPPSFTCESKTVIQKETIVDSGTRDVNYIQAAHVSFDYSCGNGGLVIKEASCSSNFYGSSNQPSMFTGNTIIYVPYDDKKDRSKLKEGMFVRYLSKDGTTTVHRISALYPDYLRTQGDNNPTDEKINYEDITNISLGVLYT